MLCFDFVAGRSMKPRKIPPVSTAGKESKESTLRVNEEGLANKLPDGSNLPSMRNAECTLTLTTCAYQGESVQGNVLQRDTYRNDKPMMILEK